MSIKKVVISGITSALGLSLARMLEQKHYQVFGFARSVDKARALLPPTVVLTAMDLQDDLDEIMEGADSVVHIAALSSLWGEEKEFYRVNVQGTQAMVRAARVSRVRRFVHISTPSLYFGFQDQFNIEESVPFPDRFVNFYVSTKKIAEEVIDDSDLNCLTIRPRAIFGPHDRSLLPKVLKVCMHKGIPRFSSKNPLVDVTYVDNVAHAIWLCLTASDALSHEKYNITNGEPMLLWNLLSTMLHKLSIPIRFWKIPYPLAYCGASLAEWISKEPALTRYGVGVLTFSQTLSIEKAVRDLGYAPIVTLTEGIDRYVQWHQTT